MRLIAKFLSDLLSKSGHGLGIGSALSLPPLILVMGGTRSGKSRFGEELALNWQAEYPDQRKLCYVATAMIYDDSMSERIKAHQERRNSYWINHEVPLDVGAFLQNHFQQNPFHHDHHLLFIDCLTMWITNHLMQENPEINTKFDEFISALRLRKSPIILISNENNMGLHGDTPLGRLYQDHIGTLHQRIGHIANQVILMVAGQPLYVKNNISIKPDMKIG